MSGRRSSNSQSSHPEAQIRRCPRRAAFHLRPKHERLLAPLRLGPNCSPMRRRHQCSIPVEGAPKTASLGLAADDRPGVPSQECAVCQVPPRKRKQRRPVPGRRLPRESGHICSTVALINCLKFRDRKLGRTLYGMRSERKVNCLKQMELELEDRWTHRLSHKDMSEADRKNAWKHFSLASCHIRRSSCFGQFARLISNSALVPDQASTVTPIDPRPLATLLSNISIGDELRAPLAAAKLAWLNI